MKRFTVRGLTIILRHFTLSVGGCDKSIFVFWKDNWIGCINMGWKGEFLKAR